MSKEVEKNIPGNGFADSKFGRFMVWAGEQPVAVQFLTPGVVVSIVAVLFGVPPIESVVAGGVGAVGTYLLAIKAQA